MFISVAPIVIFDESSLIDISLFPSIYNISFIFNTLQSNGTLFQLSTSKKQTRFTRQLTSENQLESAIIGKLINGRFHLFITDNETKLQEYELRNERILNDGHPHLIKLDLNNNLLIIDQIYNQSLTKVNNKAVLNKLQLIPQQSFNGWLQDLRINDQSIGLDNSAQSSINDLNMTILNVKTLEHNPCYPVNPCQNQAICLVTNSYDYS